MPVAGGGFDQCYNAQAAVAAGSLLVVTGDVVQAPNDKHEVEPMLDKLGVLPAALGETETLLADAGYFLFSCYKSTTLAFVLDPRGYRGHALRKVLDVDQPFILEVRPVSGENQKFPLIAYMAGDGAWPTGSYGHERGLTGSAATAFLDAFGREGRLSFQTGNGVELASWTLKGMSKVRELVRNTCQL